MLYFNQGNPLKNRDKLSQQALEIYYSRELLGKQNETCAKLYCEIGNSYFDAGEFERSQEFNFVGALGIDNKIYGGNAATCRHNGQKGGYGNLISNNHFRSSNVTAIDIAVGRNELHLFH